ncbi:kinase-like protein [Gigaspora margarita]|uniref:Kinase-like protein n=1 Tax=Gigaspora margarita TaxID=4874 RepID=A0A8H3WVK5_GIGMA|nr:kinase-like protein [Gigaspora margarita]
MHSKNILVHDKKLLIADFGLSKDETSKTSSASVYGMQAYLDPQCFKNESYKRSKKSDIYSFGIILWEISSGRPPFQSLPKTPYGIIIHVFEGGREKPVEGTPDSYIQLYKRCWNYDPNQRPELEEIQESLLDLSGKENFGTEIISGIPLPTNSMKEKRRKKEFDEFLSEIKISNSDIPLSTNSREEKRRKKSLIMTARDIGTSVSGETRICRSFADQIGRN